MILIFPVIPKCKSVSMVFRYGRNINKHNTYWRTTMQTLLSDYELISLLSTKTDVSALEDTNLETLIRYMQNVYEYFAKNNITEQDKTISNNYVKLSQYTAKKLKEKNKGFVLFSKPLMPLITEESGDYGIVVTTTEETAKILIEEQKKLGKNCFYEEMDDLNPFFEISFLVQGYKHILLWNSDFKGAFIEAELLVDESRNEYYQKYTPNEGLSSKLAAFSQFIVGNSKKETIDEIELFQREILTFSSLMDAELLVPIKKMHEPNRGISADEFENNVPQIKMVMPNKTFHAIPVFTDGASLMSSPFKSDKYDCVYVDIETLIDIVPCEYLDFNPREIDLILNKQIIADKIDQVKKFCERIRA